MPDQPAVMDYVLIRNERGSSREADASRDEHIGAD
jgi:hypothetical protein